MLSEETIERIADRLANRMEQVNIYALEIIGNRIKEIGEASATDLIRILNQIQFGGDIDKIMQKLAEMTNLNIKDVYEVFEEVAKNDLNRSKELFEYKNKKFIPWEENDPLKRQINAMAKITADEFMNIARTTVIEEMYKTAIDTATLSVVQGQDVFQHAMYKVMNDIGDGIKTVEYESGYKRRIDTAIRMNMMDAMRDVHNETELLLGQELGSDGVEISVHTNPAPDHADTQGKQFSNEEYEKMQNNEPYKDIQGRQYEALDRVIGQWNCYHTITNIVIGISKPRYTDKELEQIQKDNEKGFEFEGKHYTNYEGEQLLRKLETELRRQKDKQIIGKASGNKELISKSQKKITILTNKYRDVVRAGNLRSRMDRARVQNYHRINVAKMK